MGILKDLKHWTIDEKIAVHHHENQYGVKYNCQDFTCNFWFWHDPEVVSVLHEYERFEEWVSKDIEKFTTLLMLSIREEQKKSTGLKVDLGPFRIKVKLLIKILSLVLPAAAIGVFIRSFIGVS